MKVNIVKSKNCEQVYILKSFRKNGKSTSSIFKKLGTMEDLLKHHHNNRDDVIAWANAQAKFYTEKEKNNDLDVILQLSQSKQIDKDINTFFNGGYLFLKDIFFDLKLDKICNQIASKHKFTYNLSHIIEMLIYTRIIYPSSKLSSFRYAHQFIEAPDYDLQHVYRALSVFIEENDFIQSSLYRNSLDVVDRNTSVLYYDCTNFFFEIEQEYEDKCYGKSKENRPNPIVQMGLFMDGSGIPLAFNITPGNTSEQKTLQPTEKKILKDFKLSKFIICTDAGLASQNNRKFNNVQGRSYIVTQSLKKLKKHLKEWALEPTNWTLDGKTYDISKLDEIKDEEALKYLYGKTFYKERWINEDGLEQRFIVSYSLKYRDYQRKIRQGQIDRAMKMEKQNKTKTHKNPNDPARFLTTINTTENGEVADEVNVQLNQKKIDEEARYDGFYGVCTTLEDNIYDIIHINKQRWEIEESFRIMKSEFDARPVYLERKDRIRAHFLICYLTLVLFRILEKKTNETYTACELIKTLKDMNFKHYEGYGYIPTYIRTDITDCLHEIFKIRTDTEIVSEKNMKKFLKQMKT